MDFLKSEKCKNIHYLVHDYTSDDFCTKYLLYFNSTYSQGRQVGYGGYGDSTPSEAMAIEFHRQQCQKT